jgi:hypothetical protein
MLIPKISIILCGLSLSIAGCSAALAEQSLVTESMPLQDGVYYNHMTGIQIATKGNHKCYAIWNRSVIIASLTVDQSHNGSYRSDKFSDLKFVQKDEKTLLVGFKSESKMTEYELDEKFLSGATNMKACLNSSKPFSQKSDMRGNPIK